MLKSVVQFLIKAQILAQSWTNISQTNQDVEQSTNCPLVAMVGILQNGHHMAGKEDLSLGE